MPSRRSLFRALFVLPFLPLVRMLGAVKAKPTATLTIGDTVLPVQKWEMSGALDGVPLYTNWPQTTTTPHIIEDWGFAERQRVEAFIEKHGLKEHYERFLGIVKDCFPASSHIYTHIMYEPDCPDDEWLSVEVDVEGSLEEVLVQDRAFSLRQCEEIPNAVSGYLRLSLDVITDGGKHV